MTSSGDLVKQARAAVRDAPKEPQRHLAVVTCIDARVDPWRILGIGPGEIHTIRNAGAVITDDVIRSLVISNRAAGVTTVQVMMHTDCAVHGLDESMVAARAGGTLPFSLRSFEDLETELRAGVAALEAEPLLELPGGVRGTIYDVKTGNVTTVV